MNCARRCSGSCYFFFSLPATSCYGRYANQWGIAAGIENLQWLFTLTFLVMLVAVPLFAWLSSRVPRLRFIDWVYGFFGVNLLVFVELFQFFPDSTWLARVFYVWISVYNLFVVSVAWSLMADVFDSEQAKRLFAFIAAGASVGGLLGRPSVRR